MSHLSCPRYTLPSFTNVPKQELERLGVNLPKSVPSGNEGRLLLYSISGDTGDLYHVLLYNSTGVFGGLTYQMPGSRITIRGTYYDD